MPLLPDTAVCLQCGYSLRGLPGNLCPECGRHFDPSDDTTFTVPREPWRTVFRRRLRELASPPSRTSVVLSALAAFVFLWPLCSTPASEAYHQGNTLNVLRLFAYCVVTICAAYACVRAVCITRLGRGISASQGWLRWTAPVVLLAMVCAEHVDWPLRLRFLLSRPFIAWEVSTLRSAGQTGCGRLSAGLFLADRLVVSGDGRVRLVLHEKQLHEAEPETALSYEPHRPVGSPDTYLLDFGGHWYLRSWGPRSTWYR